MEESGHYYTVYFTSLAVGFNEKIAYRHAVLAQMPDEVGWLDAAHMHMYECSNFFEEVDLAGKKRSVNSGWRSDVESAIHSLPDKVKGNSSSYYQQVRTKKLLSAEDPISLTFGLLLHRLGDTYAHSVMGDESRMYTVSSSGSFSDCFRYSDSIGHARHFHDPDYPFLRTDLFDKYITELYSILSDKARQPGSASYVRKSRPLLLEELKNLFSKILTEERGLVRSSIRAGFPKETTQIFFIQKIREQAIKQLGITMKKYAPERKGNQTLSQFLSEHDEELSDLKINEQKIIEAVNSIKKGMEASAKE